MKTGRIVVGLWCVLPLAAGAQAPPAVDYPARVQSVENLKQHIAEREARFESVKGDLRILDARVEEQIDRAVKTLAELKDSNESKTRVAHVKGDVIQALVRTIGVYRQKRMDVYERLRRDPNLPREQWEKALAAFDARIGRRFGQVMELARSFPGHQDVEKYVSDGGSSYWNGWYEESTRVNEDWKQNRRESNATDVVRRELLQGIDKALETSRSRRAAIADALAHRKLTDQDRAVQQEELGRIDAAIDNLRLRRRELALPGEGATRELGRDEIHDAEQLLDDARADLARDIGDIMRKVDDLAREAERIHALKENLRAREQWLKDNPPPKEGATTPGAPGA